MEWNEEDTGPDRPENDKSGKKREFVGVFWECCKVYSRVYLNARKTAFVGWCPKCGRRTQLNVSPTGTKSRFFNVG